MAYAGTASTHTFRDDTSAAHELGWRGPGRTLVNWPGPFRGGYGSSFTQISVAEWVSPASALGLSCGFSGNCMRILAIPKLNSRNSRSFSLITGYLNSRAIM